MQMNQQDPDKIQNVGQLPVKNRRKTDFFCMIFLTTYIVLLALICIFIHNSDNLNRITYPNDNEGKLCGYDPQVANYPYLYYTSLTDPTKRLCVNQCPLANSTQLSCKPTATLGCRPNSNPKYEVKIYNTYLDEGRIGLFCLPTDNNLKDIILKMSNTESKYAIFSVVDAILTSAWTAVLCGIVIFLLNHFWPYKVVPWVILLGAICSILFGIFILTLTAGFLLVKILLTIFFLFLGFMSLKTLYDPERRQSVVVCTRLIGAATLTHTSQKSFGQLQLSLQNIKNLGRPLLLIVCFALVYILFFYINMKQVLSVWSTGKLFFVADKPFYAINSFASNFLMILVGIQIIWGAFFIKQAYNFIAANHSVSWYFGQDNPSFLESAQLLLRYHWGSVVGGSLIQGFFYFFELFYNFFFDEQAPIKQHPKTYKHSIEYERTPMTQSVRPVKQFFDLVRGQALAYVSLVGIPYCNAARHCEFLSQNSPFYFYGQTTNRILRINMHFLPMFIVLCVGMSQMGALATPYSILIVAILSYFIITYFLSYHGQKAEGLLISLYTDQALNDGTLTKAPNVLKQTYKDDLNHKHQGITISQLLFNKDTIIVREQRQ